MWSFVTAAVGKQYVNQDPTVDFIRKIRLKENNNLTLINMSHIASAYLEITS